MGSQPQGKTGLILTFRMGIFRHFSPVLHSSGQVFLLRKVRIRPDYRLTKTDDKTRLMPTSSGIGGIPQVGEVYTLYICLPPGMGEVHHPGTYPPIPPWVHPVHTCAVHGRTCTTHSRAEV